MSLIFTKTYGNNKIQEFKIDKFPVVIFSDSHCNINNIKKLQELYPNNLLLCLGDITFLFSEFNDERNAISTRFFMHNKIPCLMGNHDSVYNKYNLFQNEKDFLKNLPMGFKLILPNGKYYLLYHNEPGDLWTHYDYLNPNEFEDKYLIHENCLGIIQGHLHQNFVHEYKGIVTKRIGIGQLCNSNRHSDNTGGNYALLTENGVEFKKI